MDKRMFGVIIFIALGIGFISAACIDSDGFGYYTKGEVTVKSLDDNTTKNYQDACVYKLEETNAQHYVKVDNVLYNNLAECSAGNCYVAEAICSYNDIGWQVSKCDNGCKDRACLPLNTCTDSDRGKDYYKKGSVNYNDVTNEDSCVDKFETMKGRFYRNSSGPMLDEWYCDSSRIGDEASMIEITCPNGCKDGVCLSKSAADCKNLYWFDSNSEECGYKEFCGAYMYYGLQTFETKEECEKELNPIKECKVDADCPQVCPTCGVGVTCAPCMNYKCSDGKCVPETDEIISEKITCKFEGSSKQQKCYLANEFNDGDIGTKFCISNAGSGSCVITYTAPKGEKVTWKSSCGGYQYTTMDGTDETIYFKCREGETDIDEIKNKGFRNVYFQCYDGEESKSTDRKACKTSKFWQKFAKNFCESHCAKKGDVEKCGVNSFSISEECYVDEIDVSSEVTPQSQCEKAKDVRECCKSWAIENNIATPLCVGVWEIKKSKCSYKCSDLESPEDETDENDSEDIALVCKDSCALDGKCYPFGYRKSGKYCSDIGAFTEQLKSDSVCDNNFECSSNVCVSGKCIDEGFLQKILNWFARMFGG